MKKVHSTKEIDKAGTHEKGTLKKNKKSGTHEMVHKINWNKLELLNIVQYTKEIQKNWDSWNGTQNNNKKAGTQKIVKIEH